MKLKVYQLFSVKDALKRIGPLKLPVKASYWLARIDSKIFSEWKVVEEKRGELVQKYGVTDAGLLKVPPEKMEEFQKEFSLLLEEEIEVEIPKIKLSLFGNSEIPVADMTALYPFIDDEEGQEAKKPGPPVPQ